MDDRLWTEFSQHIGLHYSFNIFIDSIFLHKTDRD